MLFQHLDSSSNSCGFNHSLFPHLSLQNELQFLFFLHTYRIFFFGSLHGRLCSHGSSICISSFFLIEQQEETRRNSTCQKLSSKVDFCECVHGCADVWGSYVTVISDKKTPCSHTETGNYTAHLLHNEMPTRVQTIAISAIESVCGPCYRPSVIVRDLQTVVRHHYCYRLELIGQ